MSKLSLTIALLLGLTQPSAAGEAQDRLFAVGVLDGVATGHRLVFDHQRRGSFDAAVLPPIEDGEIEVALASGGSGGRVAEVTLREGGRRRTLDPLPAAAGHPLLLVFLETVVDDVARLTGGSPFYIRNRMREALRGQDAGRAGRDRARRRVRRGRAAGVPPVRSRSKPGGAGRAGRPGDSGDAQRRGAWAH